MTETDERLPVAKIEKLSMEGEDLYLEFIKRNEALIADQFRMSDLLIQGTPEGLNRAMEHIQVKLVEMEFERIRRRYGI